MATSSNTELYNAFDKTSIKTSNGVGSDNGWVDGSGDDLTYATPLDEDNLNVMLEMLINLRNIIGTTSSYEDIDLKINGIDISRPDIDNKSLADLIKSLYKALMEGDVDVTALDDNCSLTNLKNYIKNLDIEHKAPDHEWLSRITQSDGKIEAVEYNQPHLKDIAASITDASDRINFEGDLAVDDSTTLDTLQKILQKIVNDKLDRDGWKKIPDENEHGWQLTLGENDQGISKISQNGILIDPVIDTNVYVPEIKVKGYSGYHTTVAMKATDPVLPENTDVIVQTNGVHTNSSNFVDLSFPPSKNNTYYNDYESYSQIVSTDYLGDKITNLTYTDEPTEAEPTDHKFITSVTQENGKISVGSCQPDAKDITYTAATPNQGNIGTVQYALDSKLNANNWVPYTLDTDYYGWRLGYTNFNPEDEGELGSRIIGSSEESTAELTPFGICLRNDFNRERLKSLISSTACNLSLSGDEDIPSALKLSGDGITYAYLPSDAATQAFGKLKFPHINAESATIATESFVLNSISTVEDTINDILNTKLDANGWQSGAAGIGWQLGANFDIDETDDLGSRITGGTGNTTLEILPHGICLRNTLRDEIDFFADKGLRFDLIEEEQDSEKRSAIKLTSDGISYYASQPNGRIGKILFPTTGLVSTKLEETIATQEWVNSQNFTPDIDIPDIPTQDEINTQVAEAVDKYVNEYGALPNMGWARAAGAYGWIKGADEGYQVGESAIYANPNGYIRLCPNDISAGYNSLIMVKNIPSGAIHLDSEKIIIRNDKSAVNNNAITLKFPVEPGITEGTLATKDYVSYAIREEFPIVNIPVKSDGTLTSVIMNGTKEKPNTDSNFTASFIGGVNIDTKTGITTGGENFIFGHGVTLPNAKWNSAVLGTWNAIQYINPTDGKSKSDDFMFAIGGGYQKDNATYRGNCFEINANGDFLFCDYQNYNSWRNGTTNDLALYSLTSIIKFLLSSQNKSLNDFKVKIYRRG